MVAGGAGFLGSHLCERLLAEGYQVLCLDDMSTGSADNIQHLRSDARFHYSRVDVTRPLPDVGYADTVLHLASPASPPAYLRRPVETLWAGASGTRNLLELARQNAARFLFASTSEVYGDPLVHPQPESYRGNVDPIGPRSVYDEAKRFGEALTTAYRNTHAVNTAIVRIFNCYGSRMRRDDGRMIPTFATQALRGAPITV
ncbi:NAD-dependent epimerase/dehydratase family protein, partial [Streptomyces mauvecolor]